MSFLNLLICFPIISTPLNDIRPYIKSFRDGFFLSFTNDSGIGYAYLSPHIFIYERGYALKYTPSELDRSSVTIIDSTTALIPFIEGDTFSGSYYYLSFNYDTSFNFSSPWCIRCEWHDSLGGVGEGVKPGYSAYTESIDSIYISVFVDYVYNYWIPPYYWFAILYQVRKYPDVWIKDSLVISKGSNICFSGPALQKTDSSFFIIFSADTISLNNRNDTIYVYEYKIRDQSLNPVDKFATPYSFGNYTYGYFKNGSILFTDGKIIYSNFFVDTIDVTLPSHDKGWDVYVLFPKIYLFYLRNDSLFGRIYDFFSGFQTEKLLLSSPTFKKHISVEFRDSLFLIVYSELNSTWDISGIFADMLLNVGIEEGYTQPHIKSSPGFKSIIPRSQKFFDKFLKTRNIYSIAGKKTLIKKRGIYFINTRKSRIKIILLK